MEQKNNPERVLKTALQVNILTDADMDRIHESTLVLLSETGLYVGKSAALNRFKESGARADEKNHIVKLPPKLVEDAIASAPSTVYLAGRDAAHDLVLNGRRVHFTNFSEGVKINDPYTGENREPVKSDLVHAARLIDGLEEMDFCEKAIGAHDVPQQSVPLHNAEAFLSNTTKHCAFGPGNGKLLNRIVAMAAMIAGSFKKLMDRPLVSFTTCPVSPLKLISECCEIIMESARNGVVCNILSMAMAGATSPVTLAGTLVTHNAEILGGLTLSQLTRKGAPVIYGSSTTAMDLRFAQASVGTPECALISGAVARLARYYALPSYVAGG
jgi:trimethylamine--corrinoid protein Co-methyltransferase